MTCIPGFQITNPTTGEPASLCNVVNRFVMPQPELVGKIQQRPVEPESAALFEQYPTLARLSRGENWELLLELETEVVVLNPVTMFWIDEEGQRSPSFSSTQPQSLYLEFIYEPSSPAQLRSAQLRLREAIDKSLVNRLRLPEVWSLLINIGKWLEYYTSTLAIEPFWVASGLMIRDPQFQPLSSSVAQFRWLMALLDAYRATMLPNFRENAFLVADTILARFYGAVPIDPAFWFPRWLINPGSNTQALEQIVDVAVEFVDGIGILSDSNLETVYLVYEGQLRSPSVNSRLLEGQNFRVDSWVNADGELVEAAADQLVEVISPVPANIVIADPRNSTFGPIFNTFNLGVFY